MVRETNADLDLRPMPSSARRPASQRRRTALIPIARLQLFDLGRKWVLAESVFRSALVRAPWARGALQLLVDPARCIAGRE